MYEHSARVPLIISWPDRFKGDQSRKEACSLLDLVKTIAETAGAETPADWDGDSMLHWIKDETVQWKDFAVSEYYAHNIVSGFAMYRKGDFKYVYHTRMDDDHGPERELYNLKEDPGEFRNLAKDTGYADKIDEMHRLLVAELKRDPEASETLCRSDYARGYGRTATKALTENDPLWDRH